MNDNDWIIVDGGDMFEGTRLQFRDCFFDNACDEVIYDWADSGGFKVVIIPEENL